jgi:hypothetical protein
MRVFLLVGAACASLLAGCISPQVVSEKPVQLSRAQISQVEAAVKYSLIDPDSASFRNIRAADLTLADGTSYRRVCGEVNSKNRMGGYAGFSTFKGNMQGGQFQLDYMDSINDMTATFACRPNP